MDPRLSTAFDYAELRLHPDGTRVYQKISNLRPGIIKVAVQNSRANWIARDAGGSGRIHKLRPRGAEKDTAQEPEREEPEALVENVEQEVDEEVDVDEDSDEEENPSKRKPKRVDKRKAKRQKFAVDDDYLLPKASDSNEAESPTADDVANDDVMSLPEPSPDLLKCIHRFASEFYTERGQLLNSSREYRKQRKKRARKRLRALRKEQGLSSSSGSSSFERSESDNDSENSESDAGSEQEDEDDEEDEAEPDPDDHGEGPSNSRNVKGKGKARRKRRRPIGKPLTDMYKMFDGSAIMALGMLVQEHIAHLLMPQAPAGWDDEMRNFFIHQGSEEGSVATEEDGDINQELDIVNDAVLLRGHGADGDEDDTDEETESEENSESSGCSTKNHWTPSGKLLSQGAPIHGKAGQSDAEDDSPLQTSSDKSLPSESKVNSDSDADAG